MIMIGVIRELNYLSAKFYKVESAHLATGFQPSLE